MSQVKGLDRLLRQMRSIPAGQARAAAIRIEAEADGLVNKIRAAAPKRTGDMAKGISHRPIAQSESRATSAEGRELASRRAEAGLARKITAPLPARWVEFGTKASPSGTSQDAKGKTRTRKRPHAATPAQPFFWPTVRAQKPGIRARIRNSANKAAKAVVEGLK